MFSTGRFPLKKTAAKDAAGFTLIEITMALILLGILTAIAVPKYFDMQEQAIIKKCKYDQSVVLSQLQHRYTLATAGVTGEKWGDTDRDQRINEILAELGGNECANGGPCPNLCPDHENGGYYTVRAPKALDGEVYFRVRCSVKGHTGSQAAVADSFDPAINTMGNYYMDCKGFGNGNCGAHTASGAGEKIIETLGDYFTNRNGGYIDSDTYFDERKEDYATNDGLDLGCKSGATCKDENGNVIDASKQVTSMAELIGSMLANDGIDTSQVVWKMYRADQWNHTDEFNDPNPPEGTNYHCQYIIQVASRPSDDASEESLNNVTLYKYVMTVRYSKDTDENGFNPLIGKGGVVVNSLMSSSQGSLSRAEENGHVYYKVN